MEVSDIQILNNYDELDTGDIILCHGYNPKGLDPGIDGVIEFFTHSPWEHAAMIIRDPWWTKDDLKGLYIFQSSDGPNGYYDVLNGKLSGVTLNRFDDFMCNRQHIYTRKLSGVSWTEDAKKSFVNFFHESHGKPYDTNCCSWFLAGIDSFLRCKCCKCGVPKTEKTLILP